jgi:predicted nucleic acid-binding Zn ribbon protein
MKQLERLLFLQGHRCFFCGEAIPSGEASIEHLAATSNGGAKDDENCVVCCKAVNTALGHLSVKAKLQAVLNHRGRFACPMSVGSLATSTLEPDDDRVAVVVADLHKRGSARPRRVTTLKNTMNAAFQMSLSETELDVLLARMQAKGFVAIDDTKVSYALPAPGA